jgi:hypothetical protein
MAVTLADLPDFKVRIVGCGMPPKFDLSHSAPMMGILMPGFVMEQYRKADWAKIQQTCNEIICILDRRLPRNVKPEVSYIDGSPNQLVPTLVSMCEVVAIPHPMRLAMKFRIWPPTLDRLLTKSKMFPVLFCVDSSTCRRIVVAQIDTYTEPHAEQALSLLAESFHVPVYRWSPKKSIGIIQLSETREQVLTGIPHSCELDSNTIFTEQCGTLLVIPRSVILHHLRFRKVRCTLRNWRSNCLVLP